MGQLKNNFKKIIHFLANLFGYFRRGIANFFPAVFGNFNWQAPQWVSCIQHYSYKANSWAHANKKRAAIGGASIIVMVLGTILGVQWYLNLPKPVEVAVRVNAPGRMMIEQENAKPQPLSIHFNQSVVPLDKDGKEITTGISISPQIEGRWRWQSDKYLTFEPKADWPIGEEFTVKLQKNLVMDNARLEKYQFSFKSAPFTASIPQAEFYQNPTDPNLKKIVVTVNFSHPVDSAEFEKNTSLKMDGAAEGVLGIGNESSKFNVTYDKLKLNAYIHSEPIIIPKKNAMMKVIVDSGIHAARGGAPLEKKLEKQVSIPGLFSLNINNAQLTLVNNERFEPEQVLITETSASVLEKEIAQKISAYVLPVYHPETKPEDRKRPYHWFDVTKIGPEILKEAEALKLEQIPSEREHSALHSFKYQADVGRYVYIKVDKGLKSFGGYLSANTFDRIIKIPPYPKEVKILHKGSILSMSGERKISVYTRDVPAIRFEVGRVLSHQLQHLVTQSGGDFSKPQFNYNFPSDSLVEIFNEVRDLPKLAPGKAQYQAFDLTKYLDTDNRRGLFLLKVEPYDIKNKRATGQADMRLVLITDLGVLVKRAVDGSQDVFVQSVFSGKPISGTTVEILGKNGLTVLSQTTNEEGYVRFPDLKEFKREQTPTLYVVKKANDMAFLPMNRHDRLLDLSRFEVGGVSNSTQANALSAYLFSDRGIYRPGDEIHVGMIVKTADWAQKIEGIPLEAVITDARGLVVKKERLRLSSAGFEEIKYTTQETSATGTYNVNLYIVKDNYASGLLGSTSVKVQEFLPDRLKMTANFSSQVNEGWVLPQDLKARINLQNLFGTPAIDRKITAMISLSPSYPAFSSYRQYHFYDPFRAKQSFDDRLADTKTDDKGEAAFDLNLQRFVRATYRLHFVAEGFEAQGGRGVTAEAATMVSSMPYLVGYKSDGDLNYVNKDSQRSVDLIAINPQAKKTEVNQLKAEYIERRYVSILTKQDNGTYKYESKKKEVRISEAPLTIATAGTKYNLPTNQPGDYAIVVRDAQGLELNRVEYSVAGHANLTRSLEKNAELQLTLNKSDYESGEEIEMQIKAPYVGTGLITIERDKVYTHKWFKTDTTSSVQKIKLPANLEGNGYVSVSFVRDINSDEIFMSPLSYGVAPFSVSLAKRKNPITISTPDLAKPGEAFKIRYKTDKPGKIVVFAVDEGILQVAGYKTADPLGYFFQKRALEVKTSQILDLILPEFKRLMTLAAPGGDGEGLIGKNLNPFKRKRDKPIVYWSGIIDAGPAEKELIYHIPDYFNGSLRVMAVAVSNDSIGIFEKQAKVRGDFVLNPNVPSMVAPGDEFDVSVGVANNVIGSGKQMPVTIALKTSSHLEVIGASSAELKINEMQESSVVFRVRAKEVLGSGAFNFTAIAGDKKAKYATDTSVRPAVPYMATITAGSFRDGKTDIPIPRKMYSEFRTLEAGISYLPLGVAHGLIGYLQKYPYACTEQILSQGVPAMILRARPEFGFTNVSAEQSFNHVIGVLRTRQNAEGSFGMWAANHHISEFVSVYALHFLLDAKERGYAVPSDMLSNGTNYLQQLAASEGNNLAAERIRAYAIYLLTRQGDVTTNYTAELQKRLEKSYAKLWKKDLVAVYLAATYQLLRQQNLAEGLIASIEFGEAQVADYRDFYDTSIRDAQLLYILSKHFLSRLTKLKPETLPLLIKPIQVGQYNTLSSAYMIMAFDAYAQATGNPATAKFAITEILANGKANPLVLPTGLLPKVNFSDQAAKLEFSGSGDLNIYYSMNQSGFDKALPVKQIKNGLEVLREYTDADGKPIDKLVLGEEAFVHVKFRAIDREAIYNTAIVDLLPGGFEVVLEPRTPIKKSNASNQAAENIGQENPADMHEGEGESENTETQWQPTIGTTRSTWRPDYADTREDRIVLYGTVTKNLGEFVYRIKATNVGTYSVPPTFGESMYDRSIQARSLGGKITVEKK